MAISRRAFLQAVGATAIVAPSMVRALGPEDVLAQKPKTGAQKVPGSGAKPNVILILCDDLGWGDLGEFYQKTQEKNGLPHIHTSHIDKAVHEGMKLSNAYTTAPVCVPARASMVTGKHQGHCNVRDNSFDYPIDAHMTIGTIMKAAGYDTWHIGKWGIGGGYDSNQPRRAMACDAGFDYSYGYAAHSNGHSYYHWENTTWETTKAGSPIIENISKTAYDEGEDGRYRNLSKGSANGTDGAYGIFTKDTDGNYYRRLVSDDEVRYCYDTDLFTAKLKQLIKQQVDRNAAAKTNTPFFAYTCYTTVHGSNAVRDPNVYSHNMHVPPSGIDYPASTDTAPWYGGVYLEDATVTGTRLNFKGDTDSANKYIYTDYTDANGIAIDYSGYSTYGRKRYATAVTRLDEAIGDIRHFLGKLGIAENTLIIFTSDNGAAGEQLSSSGGNWTNSNTDGVHSTGPYRGWKRWVYEGGVREPTFVVWPGTIPGVVADAEPRDSAYPFQFPAWMATLAEVTGLPQPAHCDGVSLLPTLVNEGKQLPARIYCEYATMSDALANGFEQMVRDGDYVLLRASKLNGGNTELYNVVKDKGQLNDLSKLPSEQNRLRWMENLLLTCRIPHTQNTNGYANSTNANYADRTAVDAQPLPATAQAGTMPAWEVRVYEDNVDSPWPWVPNFRTMYPNSAFLAENMDAVKAELATSGAYGVSIRGWIEVTTTGSEEYKDVTFTASGAGGCQLWIHEAHALEVEAEGYTPINATKDRGGPMSCTLRLAPGRHPFRLYLTTTTGTDGLCSVQTATGSTTLNLLS